MIQDTIFYPVRPYDANGKKVHFVDVNRALDIHTIHLFEKTLNSLIAEGNRWIVINLKQCNYINSNGLETLVKLSRTICDKNGDIYLVHLCEKVAKIIMLFKLNKFLKIYKSEKEVLLLFRKAR